MARPDILTPVGPPTSLTPMVLALDPGKTVGVCYGRVGDMPRFDQWALPFDKKAGNLTAETYHDFKNELCNFINAYNPQEVIIEAPWARGLIKDFNTLRLNVSIATITEMVCHERKIFMAETAVASARSKVVGPKAKKGDVPIALKMRGMTPRSPHQADAGAIWLHRALTRAGRSHNDEMAALYAAKTMGML